MKNIIEWILHDSEIEERNVKKKDVLASQSEKHDWQLLENPVKSSCAKQAVSVKHGNRMPNCWNMELVHQFCHFRTNACTFLSYAHNVSEHSMKQNSLEWMRKWGSFFLKVKLSPFLRIWENSVIIYK